jgi:ribosomal protein S18 acetylase RimI-like enzyme
MRGGALSSNPEKLLIAAVAAPDRQALEGLSARLLGNGYLQSLTELPRAHTLLGAFHDGQLIGFVLAYAAPAASLNRIVKGHPVSLPVPALRADSSGTLGVLQTIGVDPVLQRQGIATRLVTAALDELSALGADTCLSIAWKNGQAIPIGGVLERNGFSLCGQIDNFWEAESRRLGYVCPVCGTPCRCSAMLYLK